MSRLLAMASGSGARPPWQPREIVRRAGQLGRRQPPRPRRSGGDSNPRALAGRRFSRPLPSSTRPPLRLDGRTRGNLDGPRGEVAESGRKRLPAKKVRGVELLRGFKSHPLRCHAGGCAPARPAAPQRPGGTMLRRPRTHSSAARHDASASRRSVSPCAPAAGYEPRNFTSACLLLRSRRQSATSSSRT